MTLIPFIKKHLINLPYPVGAMLARIPYQYKPIVGNVYKQRLGEIEWFDTATIEQKREFIFARMKTIVEHAATNIRFYRRHYEQHGFRVTDLTDFESLQQIPTVAKANLQEYDITERSEAEGSRKRFLVNTGGSTGAPLGFYVEDSAIGHERAHILKIWSKSGFKPSDYTLVFAGRSKYQKPVQYDSMRHGFFVDIYQSFDGICDQLRKLFKKRKFKFLHGYPSALFEFALHCDSQAPDLRDQFRKTLKGIFLGSEFPQKMWRDGIEKIFGAATYSHYGHTERCVLAYEMHRPYEYCPLHSYGFGEAIRTDGRCELVGTGYYNFTCPMIRYNTEDEIGNIEMESGLLKSFEITTGRKGEVILDANNQKIPLTGLVFGRHHKLFDLCSHIQVSQPEAGKAIIHYCVIPEHTNSISPADMFDSSNVKMEFEFHQISRPIKTQAGKIRILVDQQDLDSAKGHSTSN